VSKLRPTTPSRLEITTRQSQSQWEVPVVVPVNGVLRARRGSPDPAASLTEGLPLPPRREDKLFHHRTALSGTSFPIFPPEAQ
jgi:hypothetical protein